VGGSFNAATDRESTVYWVRVPRREATRGMDVLGELIVRPVLADAEIDHERTVIVEEIRSYYDDPVEYAQILFQQAMFGDGPLGREICGEEADIRSLTAETIRDFWSSVYRPANTVVAVKPSSRCARLASRTLRCSSPRRGGSKTASTSAPEARRQASKRSSTDVATPVPTL
jgi:secreted Zn-dependent insulinase-like peptidase